MAIDAQQQHNGTEENFIYLVKINANKMLDIPDESLTYDICMEAVKQKGLLLKDVPLRLVNETMIEAAINQTGRAIAGAPEPLLNGHLCLKAVMQDGLAVGDVPEEYLTEPLCEAGIRQNIQAFWLLPESRRTMKICLLFLMKKPFAWSKMPEEFKRNVKKNDQIMKDFFFVRYYRTILITSLMLMSGFLLWWPLFLIADSDVDKVLFSNFEKTLYVFSLIVWMFLAACFMAYIWISLKERFDKIIEKIDGLGLLKQGRLKREEW